jgi:phytoene synthase
MEPEPLLAALPVEQRLALSYAPRRGRAASLAVLALDGRLARVALGGKEPVLAQLRLAWWRDRFKADRSEWPEGEPLLALLRETGIANAPLGDLVDAWERLLVETDGSEAAIEGLLAARSAAWLAVGEALGQVKSPAIDLAARQWALADLAHRLGAGTGGGPFRQLAETQKWSRAALPRDLRALAVLAGLARHCRSDPARALLSAPGDALTALRIGLIGR